MSSDFSISDLNSPEKGRKVSTPASRMSNRWDPAKTDPYKSKNLSFNNVDIDTQNTQAKATETLNEICFMMEKVTVYSNNTGLTLEEMTPKSKKGSTSNSPYNRSPFGKELGITDYSSICTPTKSKNRDSATSVSHIDFSSDSD